MAEAQPRRAEGIDNLGGWLTTVVARGLDMLGRASRGARSRSPRTCRSRSRPHTSGSSPEHEALLADSVGLALLVVLDRLTPVERLAFVLHDMFADAVRGDWADRRPFHRGDAAAREPGAASRARRRGARP